MDAFWIILTGTLVALNCGLLGSFLILRQSVMVGDAISHAVLPGLVVAFLLTGSLDSLPILLGAATTGLLTTFLIEFLNRKAKLQADAAIGVIFTALFALGVLLIALNAESVDLDQDCVLYGEISYVTLDLWTLAGLTAPRAVWLLGFTTLLTGGFVWAGYRPLALTTFDPAFAAAIGLSTALWQYLLMGLVSLVTVVSFESVGAILVVALMTVPPATAYLLTRNLPTLLALTALFGALVATGGYWLAVWVDGSVAGAMATVSGALFALALPFRPEALAKLSKRPENRQEVAPD